MKSLHPSQEDSYSRLIRWIRCHPGATCYILIFTLVIAWVVMLIAAAILSQGVPHYSGG